MFLRTGVVPGFLAALLIAPIASAASVNINSAGLGELRLNSFAYNGAFDGGSGFTQAGLGMIHQDLNSHGVSTDGVVTILLAQTDAGMSLMSLVDNMTAAGGKNDSSITMLTGVRSSTPSFMSGLGSSMDYHSLENGNQVALGKMFWNGATGGDAAGWSGLEAGDEGMFEFTKLEGSGLAPQQTVQFVSWTGDTWEVVATGAFASDMFGFSFVLSVVPLPPALLAGLGGLAFVAARRRRTPR